MYFDVFEFRNSGGRDYNEDSIGYSVYGDSGIFVVADGLGGHSYGEIASACVKDTLLEDWAQRQIGLSEWINEKITLANSQIIAIQSEKKTILKSTVVALAIDGNTAVWGHSGDSRLYYVHNGWIKNVTEDHSVAYKKYKAGEISREAICTDEDQSRLLRSLGGDSRYEPDIYVCEEPLEPGDGFLLCSDGAWEYLRDGEVAIDMLKAEDAEHWAELLMLRMMDRIVPGNDNLSLMTIMLK